MKKLIVLGLLAAMLIGFGGSARAFIWTGGVLGKGLRSRIVAAESCVVNVTVARRPRLASVSIKQGLRVVCLPVPVGGDGQVSFKVPRGAEYRVICRWVSPFYVRTRSRTISVGSTISYIELGF